MIGRAILVIAVALCTRFACAAEPVESEVDGTWEVMDYTQAGKRNEMVKEQKYVVIFADGVQTTRCNDEQTTKVNFEVDSKANPKVITLTDAKRPNRTTVGIYEIHQFKMGVLKIAIYTDDKQNNTDHPKDFEFDADKTVVTYRRVAP